MLEYTFLILQFLLSLEVVYENITFSRFVRVRHQSYFHTFFFSFLLFLFTFFFSCHNCFSFAVVYTGHSYFRTSTLIFIK